MHSLRLAISTGLLLLVSGCGTEPATVIVDSGGPGTDPSAPAVVLPEATDEAGLRSAASRALSDQRLYSPAGDNAIEHYLALRAITTGDDAVETALLELLPYAQIAIEQATVRGEWDEARRLIGLVERTDAGFPGPGQSPGGTGRRSPVACPGGHPDPRRRPRARARPGSRPA